MPLSPTNQESSDVRIWLVEDNSTFRKTVAQVIDRIDGLSCERMFASCEDALTAFRSETPPRVVLLDVGLPGMSGIDGIRAIKALAPETQALILTVFDDEEKIFQAICAGASGYLLKGATIDELVGDYLRRRQSGETGGEYETLTARELELLPPLLADEDTNEAIALKLGLSTLTVRTHR